VRSASCRSSWAEQEEDPHARGQVAHEGLRSFDKAVAGAKDATVDAAKKGANAAAGAGQAVKDAAKDAAALTKDAADNAAAAAKDTAQAAANAAGKAGADASEAAKAAGRDSAAAVKDAAAATEKKLQQSSERRADVCRHDTRRGHYDQLGEDRQRRRPRRDPDSMPSKAGGP